jgi:hypothetical protein
MTFQLAGAVGIVVGLIGTWLAGRRAAGWLVCVVSTVLWFPALVTGHQWAAVINCVLSIGICLRNFREQAGRSAEPFGASTGGRYSP